MDHIWIVEYLHSGAWLQDPATWTARSRAREMAKWLRMKGNVKTRVVKFVRA